MLQITRSVLGSGHYDWFHGDPQKSYVFLHDPTNSKWEIIAQTSKDGQY